jgi:hypothetical protein
MKSRLIDRLPEWPLVKLSLLLYQCELPILVACTQLIQCACRTAGPPSRTAGIRKFTLKVWQGQKATQLSLYAP